MLRRSTKRSATRNDAPKHEGSSFGNVGVVKDLRLSLVGYKVSFSC